MEELIINHKLFQPITVFTSMVICFHALKGIKIFTILILVVGFLSAVMMARNIYNNSNRLKNSLIELAYVLVIFLIMKYMPKYIYTFYSVAITIIVFAIYILVVNPKFMDRNIIYDNT